MSFAKPNLFPEWASNPPAATITEPSAPEKEDGFQPGSQAQVVDFDVANVLNAHTYNVTINGVAANYLSDGSATLAEIKANLNTAVNALSEPVTSAETASGIRVTADVAGQYFVPTTTDGANITITEVDPNVTGKPIRQYVNWLFNLLYQWILWFDAIAYRTFDLFSDQAVPSGLTSEGVTTAPTLGAGLHINAANFNGRVYVNGFAVGPVASPDYTYGASKDTYWDLSSAGVWTAVAVNNGAGEPAVTANSIRVYKVVTNATDRTTLTDRRRASVKIDQKTDFNRNVRYGDDRTGSAAQYGEARQTTRYQGGSATGYTLVHEFPPNSGSPFTSRLYIRHSDGRLCNVKGASWNGTNWDVDAGAAFFVHMIVLDGFMEAYLLTPTGSPFPDSEWYQTQDALGAISKKLYLAEGIELGSGLDGSDFEKANIPRLRTQGATNIRSYTLDGAGFALYGVDGNAIGTDGKGRGAEIVSSGTVYDADLSKWSRSFARNTYKLDCLKDGVAVYYHPSGGSATWDDVVSAGNWELIYNIDAAGVHFVPPITADGLITAKASIVIPNTSNNMTEAFRRGVDTGSQDRWLVSDNEDADTGIHVREFIALTADGIVYEKSTNADFDGTDWTNDVIGQSWLTRGNGAKVTDYHKQNGSVTTWADSAWRKAVSFNLDGTANHVMQSGIIDFSDGDPLLQGNPSVTDAQTNILCPKNILKAWAVFEWNGSTTPDLIDGFNMFGMAANSGTKKTNIGLAAILDTADCAVTGNFLTMPVTFSASQPACAFFECSGVSVDIMITKLSGLAADPTNADLDGMRFCITIHGSQA